jgi:hypothetical protein
MYWLALIISVNSFAYDLNQYCAGLKQGLSAQQCIQKDQGCVCGDYYPIEDTRIYPAPKRGKLKFDSPQVHDGAGKPILYQADENDDDASYDTKEFIKKLVGPH